MVKKAGQMVLSTEATTSKGRRTEKENFPLPMLLFTREVSNSMRFQARGLISGLMARFISDTGSTTRWMEKDI